jgi:hypothetical protein
VTVSSSLGFHCKKTGVDDCGCRRDKTAVVGWCFYIYLRR